MLRETHDILSIAFFDHFYHTNHIETAVHMVKKASEGSLHLYCTKCIK